MPGTSLIRIFKGPNVLVFITVLISSIRVSSTGTPNVPLIPALLTNQSTRLCLDRSDLTQSSIDLSSATSQIEYSTAQHAAVVVSEYEPCCGRNGRGTVHTIVQSLFVEFGHSGFAVRLFASRQNDSGVGQFGDEFGTRQTNTFVATRHE